jgi:hypothetical protein
MIADPACTSRGSAAVKLAMKGEMGKIAWSSLSLGRIFFAQGLRALLACTLAG